MEKHIDYPYLCPTCKHNSKEWDELPCDGCCGNRCYEPQDAEWKESEPLDEVVELIGGD